MQETDSSTIQSNDEETPQKSMRSFLWLVLVFVAFVAGLGAGYLIWAQPLYTKLADTEKRLAAAEQSAQEQAQAQAEKAQTAEAAEQAANPNQQVKRYNVPVDDDPVLGNSSAKITIVEFSDYECPFCRRWHQEVFPKIQEKYGDQVRFVYRDFPLISIHPNATPAAEAANCAGEQNRYWEFSNLLFKSEELGPAVYERFAGEVGIDVDDFKKCVDEKRYSAEVEADYQFAAELGIRSTPTFFINGLAVVGAQPFDVFEKVIDMELAGEIP